MNTLRPGLICIQCGSEFTGYYCRKFCGQACVNASRRIYALSTRPKQFCEYCEKPLAFGTKQKTYCSRNCAARGAGEHQKCHSEAFRERVRELWDQGLTTSQIGAAVVPQVTKNVIVSLARRMGLQKRQSPIRHSAVFGPPPPPKPKIPPAPRETLARLPSLIKPRHEPEVRKVLAAAAAPKPVFLAPRYSAHKTCQFIEGESRNAVFCNCDSLPGYSWCAEHYERVYTAESRARAAQMRWAA